MLKDCLRFTYCQAWGRRFILFAKKLAARHDDNSGKKHNVISRVQHWSEVCEDQAWTGTN